ncbi:MAG: nicotinamide-nucleotide amidohydrolase family protein [Aggregatilineales bacterium]
MNDTVLEARLGAALRAKVWTISAAESCTGGLLLHRLTNIPGSSGYVQGGVIAYADAVKERLLGVRRASLIEHGAVSEAVAREMALGALDLFATEVAISITGIAGPGGATPTKPVGLTFIGIAIRSAGGPPTVHIHHDIYPGDRSRVKQLSTDRALALALALVDAAP